jgi:hypothetical protein
VWKLYFNNLWEESYYGIELTIVGLILKWDEIGIAIFNFEIGFKKG